MAPTVGGDPVRLAATAWPCLVVAVGSDVAVASLGAAAILGRSRSARPCSYPAHPQHFAGNRAV